MHHRRHRLARSIHLTLATCAAVLVLLGAWVHAEGLPRPLPAQALEDALDAFAKEAGIQILYNPAIAAGIRSQGVGANASTKEALRELLRGTGLTFEFVNDRTVTLKSTAASETSAGNEGQHPGLSPAESGSGANRGASSTIAGESSTVIELELEEILVTGTNIRGIDTPTSPVFVYDRQKIESSGYSTMTQLIESIPQNFNGGASGASEDGGATSGPGRVQNLAGGTGVNLRGLGSVATLVLVNGHRVAASTLGSFVDISMLPLSAVERVEVLADGASAAYGADAVGGVVNVILRRDYDGADTRLRYGSTTDDGPAERLASQAFGARWNSGNILVSAQFRDRGNLRASEREFSAGRPVPFDLLPDVIQRNVTASARQEVGVIDLFSDVLVSSRNVDRVFLQGPTLPSYNTASSSANNVSVTLGAGHYFADSDWRLEAVGIYGKDELEQAQFANYTSASFPSLRDEEFQQQSVDLKLDGTLVALPAGGLRMAIGASYREEQFDQRGVTPLGITERSLERDVTAGFIELYIPLVGEPNAVPGVQRLDLSLAGRHDDYSDFGATTNPKFGLVWSPSSSLDVRASYSTSFRVPNPLERSQGLIQPVISTQTVLAPSGTGQVPIFLLVGSEDLEPEESDNLTFGFTFAPPWLPGASLSVSYYDIEYTDRIFAPGVASNVLINLAAYGSVIGTFASDGEAQAFLDAQIASGARYSGAGTGATGVRHVFNGRLRNVASLDQSGFDVTADYRFDIGQHRFNAGINVSFIDHIDVAIAEGASIVDNVDTFGNPVSKRYRVDLGWARGGFQSNVAVNHTGSYTDTLSATRAPIDAWTTMDLSLRYAPVVSGWLKGSTFSLVATNVLDELAPSAIGGGLLTYGYDAANADPLGRFVAVEFRKEW